MPLASQKCSDKWICPHKWSPFTYIQSAVFNRTHYSWTYTWSQNTLIEKSVVLFEGSENWDPTVLCTKQRYNLAVDPEQPSNYFHQPYMYIQASIFSLAPIVLYMLIALVTELSVRVLNFA